MRTLALIIALSAVAVAPASAEPAAVTVTVIKGDLSSPDGRLTMQRRIAGAVEQLCRSYAAVESYQLAEVDECRREAKISADQQIARRLERENRVRLTSR